MTIREVQADHARRRRAIRESFERQYGERARWSVATDLRFVTLLAQTNKHERRRVKELVR